MATEWTRIREVFDAALDRAPAERGAFLDETCGDDAALRAEVEQLLRADDAATDDLAIEQPLPGDLIEQDLTEAITGHQIGGYEIQRVLGSGGMSTVFLAVQENPKREVALKTMRAGMFSPEARRRFEFESEVLGRLRHPNIAQVFEAGTWTEPLVGQEVPYFALEYVKDAVPFDQFVREQDLGLRAALELYCEICDAVSYGHQLGVIHRDLKPANVLVDPEGRAKIIDFGIARATESDIQGLTMQTRTGHVMGTLRYMAPEQLDGLQDAVDTRIDVYALGVILYEMLTGEPIVDPGTMSLTAFAKHVRELEPQPPSRGRGGFSATLPRDLDWVTRKAVASDKNDRYASVPELASDLRRFLRNEPVSVGPPTAGYHVRKFVRRNRALVVGMTAVFVVLVAGIVTTTWQMLRAEENARSAQREAVKAQTINEFFNDLLKFADPAEGRYQSRHDMTVREALDAAADLFPKLVDQPEAEAQARLSIGNAYKSLGETEKAITNLERSVALRKQELGPDHPDLADSILSLGATYMTAQKFDRALEHFTDGNRILVKSLGPDHHRVAMSILNLGTAHYRKGDLDAAERAIERALVIFRKEGKPRFLALALPFLGNIAGQRKQVKKAIDYWRESLQCYEKAGKAWHPYAGFIHRSIALHLPRLEGLDAAARQENTKLAGQHLDWSYSIFAKAYGPNTKNTRDTLQRLAQHHLATKDYDKAYDARAKLIEVESALHGPKSRETGLAHFHVATTQQTRNQHESAAEHYAKAIEILDVASAATSWDPVSIRARLSGNLRVRGKLDEALAISRKGFERGAKIGGADHPRMRTIVLELAKCLRESKDYAAAEELLVRRVAIEKQQKKVQPGALKLVLTDLGIVLGRAKKVDAARQVFAEALALRRGAANWSDASVLRAHGEFLGSIREFESGEKQLTTAISVFATSLGDRHPNTLLSRKNLADLYEAWGKPDAAARLRATLKKTQ